MLYAIGLGPGDKKLLTLKAIEIIMNVGEVIVPGKMAYDVIKDIREPKIIEFPMRESEVVVKKLAEDIVLKNHDIAFCCIGDPMLYSTFHNLYREIKKIDPNFEIEVVPGITSVFCALAKSKIFVEKGLLITTPDFKEPDVIVVMKAKRPREIGEKIMSMGYRDFCFLERISMNGERMSRDLPEKADYFSIVVAKL
ncbi:MAG: SAM-dependent methyltransferase [Archaeoglobaceae archaeon]|nr:SAM-dependent methyltransferase [Archaeoglobaceae archaeon]